VAQGPQRRCPCTELHLLRLSALTLNGRSKSVNNLKARRRRDVIGQRDPSDGARRPVWRALPFWHSDLRTHSRPRDQTVCAFGPWKAVNLGRNQINGGARGMALFAGGVEDDAARGGHGQRRGSD